MAQTRTAIRAGFFQFLFGEDKGYVCLATATARDPKRSFKQHFFEWPKQYKDILAFIEVEGNKKNVWFCVNLLSKPERKKENCLPTNLVWSDLDECNPRILNPIPQCLIESSPERFQAIWRIDEKLDPKIVEDYSKRIAYKYSPNGSDKSGWDLTQLLRVPLTRNFKYPGAPEIKLERVVEALLPAAVFDVLESPELPQKVEELVQVPKPEELPEPDTVIYKYWQNLQKTPFKQLYETEPPEQADWSKLLWRLINICLEAGMSTEETFALALNSRCNKYARDNRPISYLWREVLKADAGQQRINAIVGNFQPLTMPELVGADEIKSLPRTFVDDYKEWGELATDAVPIYHELSAFILLSAFTAGNLKLKTSYGELIPNLWGLVLGDSTLTRKTTAMRMAMDLMLEIDRDILLATDGSAEGLLTGLSTRPSKTSVFYKDEVSGFFDAINRKDYLAGMPETLTALYDVPPLFTRRLRKDTITISNPVFIFFAGGIKDKVHSLLSEEYVLSGFLPRFLIVSGDTDVSRIRTTGPATLHSGERRDKIRERLVNLYEAYYKTAPITIAGQQTEINATTEVELTKEAWQRYGEIEMAMVNQAQSSQIQLLALPAFERLSRSLLKMSCLLAASRSEPDEAKIQATDTDIATAAKYVQDWGRFTIEAITNAGRTTTQRALDRILGVIERNPGIPRSRVMQQYHLTKKEMDMIVDTLIDRGQITRTKVGRGEVFYAV